MAEEKSRPILVTLIAILYLLMGLLMIAAGAVILTGGAASSELELGAMGGAASIIPGLIFIVLFLGFWKGWSIFWYLGMLFTVLGLIIGLVSLITGMIPMIVTVLIDAIIIWYLRSDKVKAFFLG